MSSNVNIAPLVEQVAQLLEAYSPQAASSFITDIALPGYWNLTIHEVTRLNRFWRHKLIDLNTDTRNERACLCDTDDHNAWIAAFQNWVLPTVLQSVYPQA